MTVNIAFMADPHLCLVPNRRNVLELLGRERLEELDTEDRRGLLGTLPDRWSWKPASFDNKPLLAAADLLADISSELELLVLLGDLSTTGQAHDLEVAKRVFLDNSNDRFATINQEPRFGGKGLRMHVVPGNHDRYQDDMGTPGGVLFDSVFNDIYSARSGVSTVCVEKDGIAVSIVSSSLTSFLQ